MTAPVFPLGNATAFIGDAEIIKTIVNDRNRFQKPLKAYAALGMFGVVSRLWPNGSGSSWILVSWCYRMYWYQKVTTGRNIDEYLSLLSQRSVVSYEERRHLTPHPR
jgi:hypothetical protein